MCSDPKRDWVKTAVRYIDSMKQQTTTVLTTQGMKQQTTAVLTTQDMKQQQTTAVLTTQGMKQQQTQCCTSVNRAVITNIKTAKIQNALPPCVEAMV